MPNIGPLELAIVLVIVLLIFGPKRLPGLGRQLGCGMREFKDSITGGRSTTTMTTTRRASPDSIRPTTATVPRPAPARRRPSPRS